MLPEPKHNIITVINIIAMMFKPTYKAVISARSSKKFMESFLRCRFSLKNELIFFT